MFKALGDFVSRRWKRILPAWLLALVVVALISPPWDEVIVDGDFKYLPADAPSLVAELEFTKKFPDDIFASNVVLVVRRPSPHTDGLTRADKAFISEILYPRLIERTGAPVPDDADGRSDTSGAPDDGPASSAIHDSTVAIGMALLMFCLPGGRDRQGNADYLMDCLVASMPRP